MPITLQADPLGADGLAERVAGTEKLVRHRLAEHRDPRAGAFLAFGKRAAIADGPFIDEEIGRHRSGNLGRPIDRPGDDLRRDIGRRRCRDDIIDFGDAVGILDAQRRAGAGAAAERTLAGRCRR